MTRQGCPFVLLVTYFKFNRCSSQCGTGDQKRLPEEVVSQSTWRGGVGKVGTSCGGVGEEGDNGHSISRVD